MPNALFLRGVSVPIHDGEVGVTHNDWTQEKQGEGLLSGLSARFGPKVRRELDRIRRKVIEPELREALAAEAPSTLAEEGHSLDKAHLNLVAQT